MNHEHYSSLDDAVRGLLCDAVSLTNRIQAPFIVVGGWCPLLRNELSGIAHPGTADVDLLFSEGADSGTLRSVVHTFLNAGYLVSAKHDFQLLRVLPVKQEKLVFNIDLLHPGSPENISMFVDHLELDVPEVATLKKVKTVKSILMPNSAVFFNDQLWSSVTVAGKLPQGTEIEVDIPLLNEAGLVLSKLESMKSKKRPRDAFDVYLALKQASLAATLERLTEIADRYAEIGELLAACSRELREDGFNQTFDANVRRYWSNPPDKHPSHHTAEVLAKSLPRTRT